MHVEMFEVRSQRWVGKINVKSKLRGLVTTCHILSSPGSTCRSSTSWDSHNALSNRRPTYSWILGGFLTLHSNTHFSKYYITFVYILEREAEAFINYKP